MRSFLVGLAVAVAAAQDAPLFSFSGNYNTGSQQLRSNGLDGCGICSSTNSDYYYTTVNYTFPTAGIRVIQGFNIEYMGISSPGVVLNTTDLCNSSVTPLDLHSDTYNFGPTHSYSGWFNATTYTFVIGSYSTGHFAGEIWDTMFMGQTMNNNNTWNPLYESSGCTQHSYALNYAATRVFQVATSGYYSLYLGFARNSTDPMFQLPDQAFLTLFRGDFTTTNMTGIDCTNSGYVRGASSYTSVRLNTNMFNVWLDAATNYTAVASAGFIGEFYSNFGITLAPGKLYNFSSILTFDRPALGSCATPTSCTSDNVSPQKYGVATFTVPTNSYFFLYTEGPSGIYLQYYIYNENNNLRATCGTTTFDCQDDQYDITPRSYYSGSSSNWTIISTGYYVDGVGSEGYFNLYLVSGPALTTAPPTTVAPTNAPTAAPSGGTPTTAAPSGGTPTTAAPSGGTPTTAAPSGGTPTTAAPSGGTPTTAAPSGGTPTTAAPSGGTPTTAAPSGGTPTTRAPTMAGTPTTLAPAGGTPTTQAPSSMPQNTTNTTMAPTDSKVNAGAMPVPLVLMAVGSFLLA